MERVWWKEAVVYQIYSRSFKDTTGNGIGDLMGIIQKLDYIKSLGVDCIWLCPVYQSPNDDNGYDISDYRNISDDFGGNEAFDQLLEEVHERDMKLIMDLVANHSSDEHEWFKASRQSKNNPYRDYYHWKEGKNGGPPNNWISIFGGSAWQHDPITNEYFLHLFTTKQPDLNWENPKVRQEMYDIIKFWADKGIDGFRMDVISLLSKRLEFKDTESDDYAENYKDVFANGPRIHEFLQEMNREVLSQYDMMTAGEGPGIDLENAPLYVNSDRNELNMIFHFDHMFIDCGEGGKYDPKPYDLVEFKKVFANWDLLMEKGWVSVYLGNHDFSRMVSRFGNVEHYHEASSKLLATLLLTMRGTIYLYQGDEIGMTNVAYGSIEEYDDVETLNNWNEALNQGKDMDAFLKIVHRQSRDNARTPMQWDASEHGGFSTAIPWLKSNPNHIYINVASQENDENSILNYFRKMIAFRKANSTLVYGQFEDLAPDHKTIYAYRRWDENNEFLVVLNFSDDPQYWDIDMNRNYQLQVSNYSEKNEAQELLPWQAKIFKAQA